MPGGLRERGRSAAVADVTVDPKTGAIKVDHFYIVVDVGLVISPDALINQIEGGVIQAISRGLIEEVHYNDTEITSLDRASYPILRFGYS